jgi:ribosomal-protein-alanine N-acetyltransferase
MTPSSQSEWLPVHVEAMTEADLDAVLAIERASFSTPWPREVFQGELRDPQLAHLFVARVAAGAQQGRVAGYSCTWLITGELHITNFAVHPDFRRRHVGHQLLAGVLTQARALGARQAILEVRASNRAAQRLYGSLGFAPVAVRKRYYTDNAEDAIVMFLDDIGARLPASSAANSR